MRAFVIEDGKISNIIVVDNLDIIPNLVVENTNYTIGDLYSNGVFSKAPPESPTVPAFVTMRQARIQLSLSGLLSTVNAAIAAMPGTEGDLARIEWEFSSTVERDRPFVNAMIPVLGITSEQLDDLFIQAATR